MERPGYIEQMNQRIAAKPEEDAAAIRGKETLARNKRLEAAYSSTEGIAIDEAWFLDDETKIYLKAVRDAIDPEFRRLRLSNPAPQKKSFDTAAAEYYAPPGNAIVARLANSAMDAAFDRRARVRDKQEAHNREQERVASDWDNSRASEAEWRIRFKFYERWEGSDRDRELVKKYTTLYGNGIITGAKFSPLGSKSGWEQKQQLERSIIEFCADKNLRL